MSINEGGEVRGDFNASTGLWTLNDKFNGDKQLDGKAYHSFNMAGDQLQISTIGIDGVYNPAASKIAYSAKTQLQNE